jgi:hypothetical protein
MSGTSGASHIASPSPDALAPTRASPNARRGIALGARLGKLAPVLPSSHVDPIRFSATLPRDGHANHQAGDGTSELRGPALNARVASDGTGLQLQDNVPPEFPSAVVDWLRTRLNEGLHQARFRER